MSDAVLYELRDGIAELTLNRPGRLNRLDSSMADALVAAAKRAVAEGASAVVLTGGGRAFCAGGGPAIALDPGAADGSADIGTPMRSHFNPCASMLIKLPIPLVIAVNGRAEGAGVALALLGDIVVAASSASFRLSAIDVGLIPDFGATWLLPRLVGRARARGLALLGDPISASTALAWGLIWEVVDDGRLLSHARGLALRLSRQSPEAIRGIRRALDVSERFRCSEQLIVETRIQADLARKPGFVGAARHFLSGRRGCPTVSAVPS